MYNIESVNKILEDCNIKIHSDLISPAGYVETLVGNLVWSF